MNLTKGHKIGLVSMVIIAILVAGIAAYVLQNSGLVPMSKIVVYGVGTPDALGNFIYSITPLQDTGSGFTDLTPLTYSTYTPGYSYTFPSNTPTVFRVLVYLNYTLASSTITAKANVNVNITIAGVTPVGGFNMLPFFAANVSGLYWCVWLYYPSVDPYFVYWTPATNTTYNVTLDYDTFY